MKHKTLPALYGVNKPPGTYGPPLYCLSEIHPFRIEGKDYILLVSDSTLFETTGPCGAIIDAFKGGTLSFPQLMNRLNRRRTRSEVEEGLAELKKIHVIQQVNKTAEAKSEKPALPLGHPISSLICILSRDCNLRCSYCYAEQGSYGGDTGLMKEDVALRAVDFLIEQSGQNKEVQFTFFGGEPLLNLPVIKSIVSHGKKEALRRGKKINFSTTTNATLLTREVIEFFNNEGIGITISIDGSEKIHNKVRKYADGKASYETIRNNILELFRSYNARPVGARVTVTRKAIHIRDILFHLLGMGFHEVGFSPASTTDEGYALSETDLEALTQHFQELAGLYVEKAINDEHLGFSNLSNLLGLIHEGASRTYPCGGGIGLVGVDVDGGIYVCHRVIGKEKFYLGNILDAIDKKRQKEFLEEVNLEKKEECRQCWARRFCGGGCYHEIFLHHGTISGIPSHHCNWLRRWIEIGIEAYIKIYENNPGFIKRVIDGKLIC